MTRQGAAQAYLSGFPVAHLADEDDIGVQAQRGPQYARKIQADLVVYLDLVDARQPVLHRILDSNDLSLGCIEFTQCAVKRSRLSAARRSGHQKQTMGFVKDVPKSRQHLRRHTQLVQLGDPVALVKQTHDYRFAVLDRNGGQPHVDFPVVDGYGKTAVLRQTLLGDIGAGHQLQARYHRRGDLHVIQCLFMQNTVDAPTDTQYLIIRFNVDIRCSGAYGILEHALDQAHHRRIAAAAYGNQPVEVECIVGKVPADLAGQ